MNLFEPVSLGRFHAKNHFVRPAAKEQLCSDGGHIPQEIYDLYEKWAAGGLGTIIVSSARAKLFYGTKVQGLYRLDRHDLLPEYKKLSDIGHKHGVTMLIQASYSKNDINTMTKLDLERVSTHYAEAARFAEEAGFDGIEIHEAHGKMMFLSTVLNPNVNKRLDEYGQNRHLLIENIIKEIRKYTSDKFILVSKVDSKDIDGGYTEEMSIEHCKALERAGIDAIEVSGATVMEVVKTREAESYYKDFAIRLKKEVNVPVMLVGGNKSLEVMEELNNDHDIDLFSICRGTTREFDLINRWQAGDRTPSKCISCMACMTMTYGHVCLFNTENPFDYRKPQYFDVYTGERLNPQSNCSND